MNDDLPSSSAAPAGDTGDITPTNTPLASDAPLRDDNDNGSGNGYGTGNGNGSVNSGGGGNGQGDSSTRNRRRRRKNRKKRNPGLKKKLEFVTHLLKCLDTLVFAELSALYYMECSMFRLIIRAIGQLMYLSPKDETFPFLMPASRMHVALVVLPNIWCMLVHLFAALPVGHEYHRGYMHGGMIIDFVGQKPPAYRIYYLLADMVLLVLQCLMLSVHTEREKLRLSLKTFKPLIADAALEAATSRTIEDLDAEEQAIRSSGPSVAEAANSDDDIELQPLNRSSTDQRQERPRMSDSPPSSRDEVSRSRLSDLLGSGNAILGEYHILNSMRVAATELERTTAQSLQTIGYRATMAALDARRRGAAVQARQEPIREGT